MNNDGYYQGDPPFCITLYSDNYSNKMDAPSSSLALFFPCRCGAVTDPRVAPAPRWPLRLGRVDLSVLVSPLYSLVVSLRLMERERDERMRRRDHVTTERGWPGDISHAQNSTGCSITLSRYNPRSRSGYILAGERVCYIQNRGFRDKITRSNWQTTNNYFK